MAKNPSKRRMTRDELRHPDEVMSKLQTSYDWLNRYRFVLLGAVGLVVVVVAAVSIWSSMRKSGSQEESAALDPALHVMAAPVITGDEEVPEIFAKQGVPVFKKSEAKYKAALEKLQAFTKDHEGTSLADLARSLEGAARYELGDFQAAVDLVSAYLNENPESPLALVIHEELGLALTALGKTDEAVTHFQKMTEASDWWFKATAHMRIGDLHSPLLGSKAANKEKAVASYKEALTALPDGGNAENLPTAPRFLRDELEKRIALLQ